MTESIPTKFTDTVRQVYLDHLALTGERYGACRAAGMSYKQVSEYYLTDGELYLEDFADARDEALAKFAELLAAEVRRRAVDGWIERELIDKDGKVVGHVKKYSDRLLELALKRENPAYREHVSVDSTLKADVKTQAQLPIPADFKKLDRAGRDALRLVMDQMQADDAFPALPEGEEIDVTPQEDS